MFLACMSDGDDAHGELEFSSQVSPFRGCAGTQPSKRPARNRIGSCQAVPAMLEPRDPSERVEPIVDKMRAVGVGNGVGAAQTTAILDEGAGSMISSSGNETFTPSRLKTTGMISFDTPAS